MTEYLDGAEGIDIVATSAAKYSTIKKNQIKRRSFWIPLPPLEKWASLGFKKIGNNFRRDPEKIERMVVIFLPARFEW